MRKWRCHLSLIVLFIIQTNLSSHYFQQYARWSCNLNLWTKISKDTCVQRNKDKPSDTFNNRKTIKQWILKNIWSFDPCSFHADFPEHVELSCSRWILMRGKLVENCLLIFCFVIVCWTLERYVLGRGQYGELDRQTTRYSDLWRRRNEYLASISTLLFKYQEMVCYRR